MNLILKLCIVLSFSVIAYQDIRERTFYWLFLPILGVSAGILHFKLIMPEVFSLYLAMNLLLTTVLLLVIFIYAKFKLHETFLHVFALGDVLFLLVMSLAFPTVSFLVLLVFGLIFSLSIHLLVKKHAKHPTVPLAGYLSLFYLLVYIGHWTGLINTL